MSVEPLDYEIGKEEKPINYATFGDRLLANIVDIPVLILPVGAGMYFGLVKQNFMILMLVLIISMLYKPLLEGIYGATIGKMVMKIKMVDDEGDVIGLGQSFMKNGIYIISSLITIMTYIWLFDQPAFADSDGFIEASMVQQGSPYGMISSIWSFVILVSCLAMLFSDYKQTLHDRVASVFCVKGN